MENTSLFTPIRKENWRGKFVRLIAVLWVSMLGCYGYATESDPTPFDREPGSPFNTNAPAQILATESPPTTIQAPETSGSAEVPWQRVIFTALSYHGRLYRYGGRGENGTGFDCSGFVYRVFADAAKLLLPRSAAEQARKGAAIDVASLEPGDLVFYNTLKKPFSHVGIYIGEGRFIHSPSKGKSVEIVDMKDRYWVQRFNGARRLLN